MTGGTIGGMVVADQILGEAVLLLFGSARQTPRLSCVQLVPPL
jgi:hypothetical protein